MPACCDKRAALSRLAKQTATIAARANANRIVAIDRTRRIQGLPPLTKSQLKKIDTAAAKAAARANAPKKTHKIKPKPPPHRVKVKPLPVAKLGAPPRPTSKVAPPKRLPVAYLPKKVPKARKIKVPCPCKK